MVPIANGGEIDASRQMSVASSITMESVILNVGEGEGEGEIDDERDEEEGHRGGGGGDIDLEVRSDKTTYNGDERTC